MSRRVDQMIQETARGKIMRKAIGGVGVALAVTVASAAEDMHTANFLLPYCRLSGKAAFANPKTAYFAGVCDGIIEAIGTTEGANRRACIPEGVTPAQVSRVVVRFGEEHPKHKDALFTAFVAAVVRLTWPCK